MDYFNVKNWSKYQHYKDRNPPWIKLHYELITSLDWVSLDDASRVLAVGCMLIASRHDGRVPANAAYVQRVAYLNTVPDFKPLIDCGFLEGASTMLATCYQSARPETEEETEEETEKPKPVCTKPKGLPRANGVDFERFWEHWPKKVNKLEAKKAWIVKKFELSDVDELIADVQQRVKHDKRWKDGFIPHCSTYLRGERWEDDFGN